LGRVAALADSTAILGGASTRRDVFVDGVPMATLFVQFPHRPVNLLSPLLVRPPHFTAAARLHHNERECVTYIIQLVEMIFSFYACLAWILPHDVGGSSTDAEGRDHDHLNALPEKSH
jgi:hypothetical protein